ncbi:MAG TPA: DUF2071 domain-containing protein [Chitinophagaceae bacterium]|nr:DUF2071 domain-containing protein [Chitinophagaceae bacterium]
MKKVFLTAEWKNLIMANYEVESSVLYPYLPAKTELDLWEGKCYISLVGFMFQHVKLRGFSIPFHTRFPEVNLRFYVRYRSAEGARRGVVFINEIVPKPAITWVANSIYKENYITLPMKNLLSVDRSGLKVSYSWKRKAWNTIAVAAGSTAVALKPGSKEEFITEHFWGYAAHGKSRTVEYQVEHARWNIFPVKEYDVKCDFGNVYGRSFEFLNELKPASVFLAEGSAIKVLDRSIIS